MMHLMTHVLVPGPLKESEVKAGPVSTSAQCEGGCEVKPPGALLEASTAAAGNTPTIRTSEPYLGVGASKPSNTKKVWYHHTLDACVCQSGPMCMCREWLMDNYEAMHKSSVGEAVC